MYSPIHLNGHLICAIDTETTGLKPRYHDIIQVCILPLGADLKPLKQIHGRSILPFYMEMKPKRPENFGEFLNGGEFVVKDNGAFRTNKLDIFRIMREAVDPYQAADLFDDWFLKLKLPFRKRIVPLGQNWPFDREFIIDWLGFEAFDQFFDGGYRDLKTAALFVNDRADFHNESIPFPKVNLSFLAGRLGVKLDHAHDAMEDCLCTAECYRRLMSYEGLLIPKVTETRPAQGTIQNAPPELGENATIKGS